MISHAQTTSFERNDTRGCRLCDHGKTGDYLHPAVRGQKLAESFDVARQPHGPCGPEAYHLDFPGLRWPGDKR